MKEKIASIALNLIPECRFFLNRKMIKGRKPSEVFELSEAELTFFLGCSPEVAKKLKDNDWMQKAEEELYKADKEGIDIITYFDGGYPAQLKEIENPPLCLYIKGDKNVLNQLGIAIVGTRYPTAYGMNVSQMIAMELAKSGLVIISGFARGIDGYAHEAAIKAEGKTIAVLGCGIDIDYPKENSHLRKEIIKNGAFVSEFPLGCQPYKDNFPLRNRIISALSFGVLIVEASEKSGALITARYALEQGKEVFAIPGSIFSLQSIGTNYLIKNGNAKLIQKAEDILIEIPDYLKKESQLSMTTPLIELENDEIKILDCIPFDEAIYLDDLSLLTNLKPAELLPILLKLELKGLITTLQGQRYCKKAVI